MLKIDVCVLNKKLTVIFDISVFHFLQLDQSAAQIHLRKIVEMSNLMTLTLPNLTYPNLS